MGDSRVVVDPDIYATNTVREQSCGNLFLEAEVYHMKSLKVHGMAVHIE